MKASKRRYRSVVGIVVVLCMLFTTLSYGASTQAGEDTAADADKKAEALVEEKPEGGEPAADPLREEKPAEMPNVVEKPEKPEKPVIPNRVEGALSLDAADTPVLRETRGVELMTIQPPEKTEYYGSDIFSSSIALDGSDLTETIVNPVIEITVPTGLWQTSDGMETTKFLDVFNTVSDGVPIVKEVTRIDGDGTTTLRIQLDKIDNTTRISWPYVMSFNDRFTPKDFTMQPTIKLLDASGATLAEKQDKVYQNKYKDPILLKKTGISEGDGQLLMGGITKPGDNNRIDPNRAELVPFKFELRHTDTVFNMQMMKTVVITDVLPTYTDSNGQTVTAKFDPAVNPGWVDNGDGTVSYTANISEKFTGDKRIGINGDVLRVVLKLSFPDAALEEGGKKAEYKNTVSMTGHPFNPENSQSWEVKDDIKFHLTGDAMDGSGMLSKRPFGAEVMHDPPGLYGERPGYRFSYANKFAGNLRNIVLTEDGEKFDSRLYITCVENVGGPNLSRDQVTLRAYRQDGTYNDFKIGDQLNKRAEDQMNETARKVQSGELTAEEAEAVVPEYIKVEMIIDENYELEPGEQISGQLKMAFKDPYHVPYSNERDIRNTLVATSKYTSGYGEDINLTSESSAYGWFVPLVESIQLSKWTEAQKTGVPGEGLGFGVTLNHSGLSNARYLKKPTFIDLLPRGVSTTPRTAVYGVFNTNSMIESYEVIQNYNNTGRDAVKVVMKSDVVSNLRGGDGNVPKILRLSISGLEVNNEIIPTRGETEAMNNDNHVYFFTDDGKTFPTEISSINRVVDTLDLNMNGQTDDEVLMAKSTVLGTMAESIRSVKAIRSLEAAGAEDKPNYDRAWTDEITTDYGDSSAAAGRFQYDLQVRNYYNTDLKELAVYDVLPYVGDKHKGGGERGSEFVNKLMGPLVLKIGENDVTNNFDIFYRTDQYPSDDAGAEMDSDQWTKTPGDYGKVTGIKVLMHEDFVLKPYETLNIIMDMRAPEFDKDNQLSGKKAVNSFQVGYDGTGNFRESNAVVNRIKEKVNIDVLKKWVGPSADSVTIVLLAGGQEIASQILTAAEGWKTTFYNLEKEKDGQPIVYTIKEVAKEGYSSVITGDATDGFVVTNTNTEKTKVSVTKKWIGPEGKEAVVKLLADGVEKESAKLTEETGWNHEFAELPKYDSETGKEIVYTVKEEPIEGYDSAITGDAGNGFVVTNTNTEKTKVSVTKKWIGKEAESATVKLFADGKEKESAKLTEETGWKHEFAELPKYDSETGKEIVYTVKEEPIGGYDSAITGDAGSGFVVTNTNTDTMDIPVAKKWIGKEAESATVKLFADGKEKDRAELKADTEWKHVFEGLPKYDSETGKEIAYTVKEEPIEGYDSAITGDPTDGFVVTNTNTEKTKVSVTKKWIGPEGKEVVVKLLADGVEKGSFKLTEETGWSHEFAELPKYDSETGKEIAYTVKEEPIEGYDSAITGDAENGFVVTNTNTATIDISVTKKWIGPEPEPSEMALEEMGNALAMRAATVDFITVKLFADGKEKVKADLKANTQWKHVFEGLPKYDSETGKEIVYTVKEEPIGGYDSAITGDPTNGFVVTNTNTEKTKVSVTKKWIGPEGKEVVVKLLADGAEKESAKLTEETDWSHEFAELLKYDSETGKEIVYTVKEEPIEGYDSAITGDAENGFVVTNTNTEKTKVSVTKKWIGPEGKEVVVKLLADGAEKGSFKLTEETGWSHEFAELLKYDSETGKEIAYTVKEEPIEGYDSAITGDAENGFVVTNTNTEKTKVSVTKKWIGPEGKEAVVKLLADGIEKESAKLTEETGWKHEFAELLKYDSETGKEIAYTVKEEPIEGYDSAVTGDATNGFVVTNTNTAEISVSVEKKWIGKEAESATVKLFADGKEKDKAVLKADAEWKHEFKGLLKYDSETGKEIVYTVKEDAIAGYDGAITGDAEKGFTVTNTKKPEPKKPGKVEKQSPRPPKTGDGSNGAMALALLILAAGGMAVAGRKIKADKR